MNSGKATIKRVPMRKLQRLSELPWMALIILFRMFLRRVKEREHAVFGGRKAWEEVPIKADSSRSVL